MRSITLAIGVLLLVAAACDGSQAYTSLPNLDGNSYTLVVDRELDRSFQPQLWDDELPATAYKPIQEELRHSVRFTPDGAGVAVGDPPASGHLAEQAEHRRLYELQDGTHTGGRFVVWSASSGVEAELTLYGSGLPVVSSQRGALVPER